ncbi:MAG: LysM peptidoglycan-binding domain-containing protein [Planctomycetes bacterium]|nr:LysM peptidoglycan-binding domain-containing protein [Planctomycetota bacterium]
MMKNKMSMVIAAGGLLVVAVLAAALFSGKKDAGNEEKKNETAKETPKMDLPGPTLAQTLGYPTVKPETIPTPPLPPVVASETPAKDKPSTPQTTGMIDYTVRNGDRVAKIAEKYGVKVEDIYKCNEGLDASNAAKIRVGQVLKVPASADAAKAMVAAKEAEKPAGFPERTVKAEAGDTAYSLAIEYYGSRSLFRTIMSANPDLPWADRLKGGEEVRLPAYGQKTASTVEASKTPENSKPMSSSTVERKSSIIPARKQ